MTDKFITDKWKSFNFTFKENDFNFPKDRVTSIAWVIFDENWDIVAIELDRWIDIPWGHIKIWETIKEALIRECMEGFYRNRWFKNKFHNRIRLFLNKKRRFNLYVDFFLKVEKRIVISRK